MREPTSEAAGDRREPIPSARWPLLERAVEHTALRSCIDEVRDGRGATMFVEGPAGIGKSTLLATAVDHARAQGLSVLTATASEFEWAVGFGVLHDLLARPLEEARARSLRDRRAEDALERSLATLGAAELADHTVTEQDASRATLLILHRALAVLAAEAPLLLCVDDAQWADAASLRFLAFLARRANSLPIGLVVAVRSGPAGARPPAVAELLASGGPRVLRPGALSPEAVGVLVRERWFEDPPPELVAACHDVTGGNPYYLAEILAALRHSDASPRERTPEAVLQIGGYAVAPLILRRLERLPAHAVELARVAAVIGEFGSPRQVCLLAGLDPAAAEPAGRELAHADLLASPDRLEFNHPLVRAAIRSSVPLERRTELAVAAGRALADEGRDEAAAPYLAELPPRGDPWVAEVLIRAGEAAAARGALDVAAALLLRALQEPPVDPSRALAVLGLAQMELGDPEAIETLRDAIDRSPTARDRARVARALALALVGELELAEAIETLERAIDAVRGEEPALAEELEATLFFQAAWDPSMRRRGFARLRAIGDRRGASEIAYRSRLAVLAFDALSACRPAPEAASLAERALSGGSLIAEPTTLHYLAVRTLALAGRPDLARGHVDQRIEEARLRGSLASLRNGLGQRAELELMHGNVIAAEVAGRSTLEVGAEDELGMPYFVWVLNEALLAQGRRGEAEEELRVANLLGPLPDLAPLNAILYSRGRVLIAAGSTLAGLEDVLEAGRREVAGGRANPALLPWRAAAVKALLDLGRADEARELSRENLDLANRFRARHTVGAALRVEASAAPPRERLGLLREAVATLEPSFARLELAEAHADLGAALLAVRERESAQQSLRGAVALAHRLGAMDLAERANAALLEAGGRRRRPTSGTGSLTRSEWRVARLAAEGRTNQQIAEELVVSVKTVETHLSRCYRKLEIAGRGELPMLGEPG